MSSVPAASAIPTVERAFAYARVVEAIHAERAVVPMRYGCVFSDEGEVIDLLRARGEEYAHVLQALDGCVEMGILLLVGRTEVTTHATSVPTDVAVTGDDSPGTSYLAGRQRSYHEQDRHIHEGVAQLERIRALFSGLFVTCRTPSPCAPSVHRIVPAPVFGLHFLIKQECLRPFRRVFRRIHPLDGGQLLLSGPWPPYNFVGPDGVSSNVTDLQL